LILLLAASTAATLAPVTAQSQTLGPFQRGVPSGAATTTPISLSILETINRALEHNLGVLTASDAISRADGAQRLAQAGLMPDINGHVSETRQTINLAAFGFGGFGGAFAGIPSIVGPFNVFDARVSVTMPVLDFRALNENRAERHNVEAAKYSYKSARDTVVLVAADAYLRTLAAAARAQSAHAQVQTAQALFTQANDMKTSGLVAGIDVLRADVQLSTERQRATAADNDYEKEKLGLAHLIGLPIGQPFTLVDTLPDVPIPEMTLQDALDRAYRDRPDYQAALERLHAAESARAAVTGGNLPGIKVNADYGDLGLSIPDSHDTYTLTGLVTVPIFQAGRSKAREIQADAELRSRRNDVEDLKATIYYDIRTAFLDLQANGEQLEVATRARDLAGQALAESRDRFAAGVANNIEVIQAQEAVAAANEQHIRALYMFNVSKALLARGLGSAEEATRRYLGGTR
jgi:outer membrane protein TolC